MKARDLLNPVETFLTPEMPLCEAVIKMRDVKRSHGLAVKGMLVKNEQGQICGLVSIKDIMRAVIPSYLSPDLSIFSWDNMLVEMTKRARDKVVGDIMTTELITIDAEVPLMVCVDLMIKKKLQRLPVTNEEKEIIGMVYMRDIYNVIADVLIREGKNDGTC